MGCMGMSRTDFCLCTPSEFMATWEAFQRHEQTADRAAWERVRMLALCTLQPHTSHRLQPHVVMSFPWDEGNAKAASGAQNAEDAAMTRNELMERYRKALRERGM